MINEKNISAKSTSTGGHKFGLKRESVYELISFLSKKDNVFYRIERTSIDAEKEFQRQIITIELSEGSDGAI